MLAGVLQDDTGIMDLIWYRAPAFLVNGLAKGQILLVHGKVELGMHRALKVMEVLLNEGVAENLIAIESRGSSEPLAAENGTASAKKKNRRVEIYVLKQ